MNAYTVLANDNPVPEPKDYTPPCLCSGCREKRTLVAIAEWNDLMFAYCQECAAKREKL